VRLRSLGLVMRCAGAVTLSGATPPCASQQGLHLPPRDPQLHGTAALALRSRARKRKRSCADALRRSAAARRRLHGRDGHRRRVHLRPEVPRCALRWHWRWRRQRVCARTRALSRVRVRVFLTRCCRRELQAEAHEGGHALHGQLRAGARPAVLIVPYRSLSFLITANCFLIILIRIRTAPSSSSRP
jgi:hypothetical protein